jgi:threonine/homoserine/homoserine lactone efflux protein
MPVFDPFFPAVIALLAVPGPTNTLLAVSGAARGVRGSLPLLPMELGGYLVAILAWGQVFAPLSASYPLFTVVSKLLAALYLGWSGIRLWQDGNAQLADKTRLITPSRVGITTLLNPKALIFALVVFPPTDLGRQTPYFIAFSIMVVCIGLGWVGIGALVARSRPDMATPRLVSRLAATALGIFAATLLGSTVG